MSAQGNSRRRFLSFLTAALLALIGLCLAVPALGYICAPLRRKISGDKIEATFLRVGPVADLRAGQWQLLTADVVREDGWEKTRVRRAVWVRRAPGKDGAVIALSPICPHLGCPINWHPEQSQFMCPCHGGIFDASGRVVGGPPPRGMDALECEVRAGDLWVKWQDFKIGVADRVAVDV
jgi:menaquinol-cytochrome c reductase iron-sulfur subunit